jgi:hypothetical protein
VRAVTQVVRYRGDTEEERQAAFRRDAANRAPAGWTVTAQISEYVSGAPGPELVVTYEREADAGGSDYPSTASSDQGHASAWSAPTSYGAPARRGAPAPRPPAGWPVAAQSAPPMGWDTPPAQRPRSSGWDAPDLGDYRSTGAEGRPWIRRVLAIGSPILFVLVSGMTPADWGGSHPAGDYFPMAVEIALMAAFLLGLGLYAARQTMLGRGIWQIAAVALAILAGVFALVAVLYFAYATGLTAPAVEGALLPTIPLERLP